MAHPTDFTNPDDVRAAVYAQIEDLDGPDAIRLLRGIAHELHSRNPHPCECDDEGCGVHAGDGACVGVVWGVLLGSEEAEDATGVSLCRPCGRYALETFEGVRFIEED